MKNLENLDWTLILQKIENFCTSNHVKSQLLKNIVPLPHSELALEHLQEVVDASEILKSGVRPFLTSLDFYPTWIIRLKKKAVLKTVELRDVRTFCLESLALKEVAQTFSSGFSERLSYGLFKSEEPLSAIDQLMSPSGEIRTDASEKLHRLFHEKNKLRNELETQLDKLVKDNQMESFLQDRYVTLREGRLVIPVRSGMQHYVPGVIHASSQTKQTVYIEPEKVIPLNNRLRQIEVEMEEEIERLLEEISKYLWGLLTQFESTYTLLECADLRLAQGQLAILLNTTVPKFNPQIINLIDLKHPSLILSQKSVISNSVTLNPSKSILLLSGPNAGGKTVLLKSIGLAAHMARCGLPICADAGSELPFFKDILISIGDSQNVDLELSTFAAHLAILSKASEKKGMESLILIDEICGSTDPEEGSCLAKSFIETFSQNQVFGVITSHLSALKIGWDHESRVMNGSLEYNQSTGLPTYQFLPGIPGQSFAIQMAKRQGVRSAIVQRAIELLNPATRKRMEELETIESMKADIQLLQKTLRNEIHQNHQEKQKYEKLNKQLELEKEKILDKEMKTAQRKVEDAIKSASAQATLDKHRQLQEIKYNLPQIVKSNSVEAKKIDSSEEFSKRFPPGTKVFLTSLGQDGLIQSTPNSKGEVTVFSNSLRLQVHWTELKPPEKHTNPTSQIIRTKHPFAVALVEEDRTIDLRGQTVEDAISELESTLDRASQNSEDRLKIIHGHGTEALKKAVRSYLSRSVHIKQWKAGSPDNGGDGVTWVELIK